MQERAGSDFVANPSDQRYRAGALQGSHGVAIPLRAVRLIDPDKSRLAAHGQANVLRKEVRIHLLCNLLDPRP